MEEGEQAGIVRSTSKLDHQVGLAPHELAERDERVKLLSQHFYNIADGTLSRATVDYLSSGGSLRLCLNEVMDLSEPCEQDRQVGSIREAYMDTVMQKQGFLHRRARKQQLRATEDVYLEAVTAKIAAVIDAQTPQEALALGQMPSLVKMASFEDDKKITEEDLAANHLYVLVDTALKEHVHRRHAIERRSAKGRFSRFIGSRALHLSVAGTVFAAAVTPRLGLLPTHGEQLTENIEAGLRVLSGTILGLSAPEVLRLKYLEITHDRRTSELQDELAGDRQLADRALRMTYNSTRYGNLDGTGRVTGRSGTDDKEENLRRFARLDTVFPHLNNDPGGKPYTGEQALGYAARLLIERKDQLAEIANGGRASAERKRLFLDLAKDILVEDVIRMKKGLKASRTRRRFMNVLAFAAAAVFPRAASDVNEASSLSRDTTGALEGKAEIK